MVFLGSYGWTYLESHSNWVQLGGVCCARVSGSLKQTSPAGQWLLSVLKDWIVRAWICRREMVGVAL